MPNDPGMARAHSRNCLIGSVCFESYATLLKGSRDGQVLVSGKALDSPMSCRLLLPLDDEDHIQQYAPRYSWEPDRPSMHLTSTTAN